MLKNSQSHRIVGRKDGKMKFDETKNGAKGPQVSE